MRVDLMCQKRWRIVQYSLTTYEIHLKINHLNFPKRELEKQQNLTEQSNAN